MSVVLCGPTAGVCDQLLQRLSDVLHLVGGVCVDAPPTAIPVGGAWEMAVIRELEVFKRKQNLVKYAPNLRKQIAIILFSKVLNKVLVYPLILCSYTACVFVIIHIFADIHQCGWQSTPFRRYTYFIPWDNGDV